jgi:hypothetical protein
VLLYQSLTKLTIETIRHFLKAYKNVQNEINSTEDRKIPAG